MPGRVGKSRSWFALDKSSAIIAVVGVALLIWGSSLPPYIDTGAAAKLFADACDKSGEVAPGWYDGMAALRTSRYLLANIGASLVLAAGSLFGMAHALGLREWRDLRTAPTPSRRWHFLALGTLSIGLFAFGNLLSYGIELARELYPWCADSIGIPMFYTIIGSLLLWCVCSVVALPVIFCFGALPAPLGSWRKERPIVSWIVSVLAGVALLALLALSILVAPTASFSTIPAWLLAAYLIAAARAALLNRDACAG